MSRIFFQSRSDYEELEGNTSSSNAERSREISHSAVNENRIDTISSVDVDESWQTESGNVLAVKMIAEREQSQFSVEERQKALVAFLFMCVGLLVSTITLALTHDRIPDRKIYKPLPDVFLDNVKNVDFLLNVSEYQIMIGVYFCIILMFFHKHRFTIAKRVFFILGILYLYRGICYYVTVLPISSKTYYCAAQSNATSTVDIIKRVSALIQGMGLSINNKHVFCGDSIFSGHTAILIMCALIVGEYTPSKLKLLHFLAQLNAITGILFLLISHSHYSIDVIVAYFITTRTFWTYHSLVHCAGTSNRTHLNKEWWSFIFNFLEKNPNRLTNEFELPWPLNLIRNRKAFSTQI